MTESPYRSLPAVDDLAAELPGSLPRAVKVDLARRALSKAREAIGRGETPDVSSVARTLARIAEREAGVTVINATGVLLHTNLGRARWSEAAIDAASSAARDFTNLEMDLVSGDRSRRGRHVESLLCSLTGAEDAMVVNNNASALLLALSAMAGGSAVPVSRGELIEIGGAYRLPDVMAAGGVRLIEVGTTNRTRVGDFEVAIQTHECGAILKVHPSNYEVSGFTSEAELKDLADLAKSFQLPMIHDLGSGLLDSTDPWVPEWLREEPAVAQSLEAGADLVLFSGDKLLGGPQAGVIVGSRRHIDHLRKHPLARALRVDGTVYAALAATLASYADGSPRDVPFWRMALLPSDVLKDRTDALANSIGGTVEEAAGAVGGGSAPGAEIPGWALRLAGEDNLFQGLLDADVPILTRRDRGDLLIDLRAVDPDADDVVAAAVAACR